MKPWGNQFNMYMLGKLNIKQKKICGYSILICKLIKKCICKRDLAYVYTQFAMESPRFAYCPGKVY